MCALVCASLVWGRTPRTGHLTLNYWSNLFVHLGGPGEEVNLSGRCAVGEGLQQPPLETPGRAPGRLGGERCVAFPEALRVQLGLIPHCSSLAGLCRALRVQVWKAPSAKQMGPHCSRGNKSKFAFRQLSFSRSIPPTACPCMKSHMGHSWLLGWFLCWFSGWLPSTKHPAAFAPSLQKRAAPLSWCFPVSGGLLKVWFEWPFLAPKCGKNPKNLGGPTWGFNQKSASLWAF